MDDMVELVRTLGRRLVQQGIDVRLTCRSVAEIAGVAGDVGLAVVWIGFLEAADGVVDVCLA